MSSDLIAVFGVGLRRLSWHENIPIARHAVRTYFDAFIFILNFFIVIS